MVMMHALPEDSKAVAVRLALQVALHRRQHAVRRKDPTPRERDHGVEHTHFSAELLAGDLLAVSHHRTESGAVFRRTRLHSQARF